MACTLNTNICPGYIPERRSEDISDLPNPFITKQFMKKNCEKCKMYKLNSRKTKDEIYIVCCFLLFVLIAKFFYK
jgi:hypothetical protein